MTFWDFSLATLIPSLLLANILLLVLLLIKRRLPTDSLFHANFLPMAITIILVCLALGIGVIIFATVTDTIPASQETLQDSVVKFFPRLAAMPQWLQLSVEFVGFLCLLITPVWTCRHVLKGQTEAREHRNTAQRKLKQANIAIYELKAKNAGLYKGYLYILRNNEVPESVKEEFSRQIREGETAFRRTHAKQKKPH